MQQQPQSKANLVIDEIIRWSSGHTHFLTEDFQWHKMVRDIQPLKSERRFEWDGVMGLLYTYVMRFDEAEACLRNSLRLNYDAVTVFNLFHSTLFAGRYGRAQELFIEHGHPNKGSFSKLVPLAMECGAFETLVAYFSEAKKMNLEVPDVQGLTSSTVRLLTGANLSEKDVARHLEAAGAVLMKHRIRPLAKRILAGDENRASLLSVLFHVPGTPDEVFDLNVELAQMEDEMGIPKHISFDVAFVAGKNADIDDSDILGSTPEATS